jgi:hypothetical protein
MPDLEPVFPNSNYNSKKRGRDSATGGGTGIEEKLVEAGRVEGGVEGSVSADRREEEVVDISTETDDQDDDVVCLGFCPPRPSKRPKRGSFPHPSDKIVCKLE